MAKFVLMCHAGETPHEPRAETMDRWMAWFGELGGAVIDIGSPFGETATIRPFDVVGYPVEVRAGSKQPRDRSVG